MELSEIYLKQAQTLFEKKWQQAIDFYKKALEINPNYPGIHQKIGDALQKQAQAE